MCRIKRIAHVHNNNINKNQHTYHSACGSSVQSAQSRPLKQTTQRWWSEQKGRPRYFPSEWRSTMKRVSGNGDPCGFPECTALLCTALLAPCIPALSSQQRLGPNRVCTVQTTPDSTATALPPEIATTSTCAGLAAPLRCAVVSRTAPPRPVPSCTEPWLTEWLAKLFMLLADNQTATAITGPQLDLLSSHTTSLVGQIHWSNPMLYQRRAVHVISLFLSLSLTLLPRPLPLPIVPGSLLPALHPSIPSSHSPPSPPH